MKLIHTFKTLKVDDKFYTLIWCTILSCLYAKQSGFTIKLYTDETAYEFLKHAPYDEIEVTLDNLEAVPSIYASSKYYALKNEPLDSIHIDCDVFLKHPNLIHELNPEGYDLIVQSVEEYGAPFVNDKSIIGGSWNYALNQVKPLFNPLWSNDKCYKMYNCGVIGFNNQNLKNIFIEQYEQGLQAIKENQDKVKHRAICDLIIEQQHLFDLCEHFNFRVKKLLDAKHLQEDAIIKGYQHLIGPGKQAFLTKVKQLVYKKDYKLYNTISQLIASKNNTSWQA